MVGDSTYSIIEAHIMDSGCMVKEMAKVFDSGQMVVDIKGRGWRIDVLVLALIIDPISPLITDVGNEIGGMELEYSFGRTEIDTLATGMKGLGKLSLTLLVFFWDNALKKAFLQRWNEKKFDYENHGNSEEVNGEVGIPMDFDWDGYLQSIVKNRHTEIGYYLSPFFLDAPLSKKRKSDQIELRGNFEEVSRPTKLARVFLQSSMTSN